MLGWSHKPSPSDPAPEEEESPIVRDSRRLARFLREEVDRGRLRRLPGLDRHVDAPDLTGVLLEDTIEKLDDEGGHHETVAALRDELERKQRRMRFVPFIDPIDVRYRRYDQVPKPVARAVMFCLMDVSGSMDEHMKDLAKRFFTLLYLFLSRKYERVELIFIRHTDNAEEVDEQRFFHDAQSGGTVVQSALKLMNEIVAERYPPEAYNIYGAQVSDGDAFGADPEKSRALLADQILPLVLGQKQAS